MIHAYNHPIRVFEFDDLTMLVGGDSAGRLLESVLPGQKGSTSSFTPCPPVRSS